MMRLLATLLALGLILVTPALAETRIKDITTVQGIRDNQLVGYGLVIGLAGTGDSLRNSPFTELSLRSMLQRMGVVVEKNSLKSKNVAAVVVTATLPPFVGVGQRIDVTVSSLGDAISLVGGTLVMTPLVAADGEAYAVAQGPVAAGGFAAEGEGASVTTGVPTAGRVPNGGILERDNTGDINAIPDFTLQLLNPDFKTATTIADAINNYSRKSFGQKIATELDMRSVLVKRPKSILASRLISDIGDLRVAADTPAKIVIDDRTGTIVIGQNVRILPVAVSHGNLTVTITEAPVVSQPEPFSLGETVVVPDTTIEMQQSGGPVAILQGPTLAKLVDGLNQMGLKPPDIVSILQSVKSAGAIQADLIVQ
jgi:flagellar P-ring protein FlgI